MKGAPGKNWLEWTVFAVGLVCIGMVVFQLASDALEGPGTAAAVVVRLGEPEQRSGRRFVPVTMFNSGDEAAAGVEVEVLLVREDRIVERARLVVDLLPRGASREGWVTFDSALAAGERLKVGGVAFGTP